MKKIISYLLIALFVSTAGLALAPTNSASAASAQPTLTPEQAAEYRIMAEYLHSAPKLPKGTIRSAADVAPIKAAVLADFQAMTFEEAKAGMSAKSVEMFNRMPLVVNDITNEAAGTVTLLKKIDKPKIYKGGLHASVKVKTKEGRKTETTTTYLVKENGVWKMDYIQTLKKMFKIR